MYFWRDANGPEVDWVLAKENAYYPIEVKWTNNPVLADIKHLQLFISEYPEAVAAYVVCRVTRKMKLADRVYALPWQEVDALLSAI